MFFEGMKLYLLQSTLTKPGFMLVSCGFHVCYYLYRVLEQFLYFVQKFIPSEKVKFKEIYKITPEQVEGQKLLIHRVGPFS